LSDLVSVGVLTRVFPPDVVDEVIEALELGYKIVHPITTEPWGVRRFLVRAPDRNVVNVVRHRD